MKTLDDDREREFWFQVGSQLRIQRGKTSKSLRQVSRELEVSPSFISQVELGKKGISLVKIMRFCKVYDISLDQLTATVPRTKNKTDF